MRRTFWDLLTDMLAVCTKKNVENPKQMAYELRTSKAQVKKLLSYAERHSLVQAFGGTFRSSEGKIEIKAIKLTNKGVQVLNKWRDFKASLTAGEKK